MKSVLGILTWQTAFKKGWDEFALQSNALEIGKKKPLYNQNQKKNPVKNNKKKEGVLTDWNQAIKRQKV